MKIFIAVAVALMLFLPLNCFCSASRAGAVAAPGSLAPKMRFHKIPGLVKFRTGMDWYQAGKEHYGDRKRTPDVLLFNRIVSKTVIQINIEKTPFSPTNLIKFIIFMSEPHVRWYWVKYNEREGSARVYFENDKKGKVGFLDVRHLPGRYSRLLVVGSGWLKKDHKKMTIEYNQIVDSIVSDP